MRQNLISHRFWCSDYGSIFENLISTLFKLRINSKSQIARTMILTKNVNGSELRLIITMNETHANHEWFQIGSHCNHEYRHHSHRKWQCCSVHGYGESQSGAIHGLRESHSWLWWASIGATFLVRIIVRAFRLFERILTLNKDEFLTTFPLSEDQNIRYINFFLIRVWSL